MSAVEALEQAPQKRVAPSLNALHNPCEGLGKLRKQILSLVKDLVAGFWRISCRKERLKYFLKGPRLPNLTFNHEAAYVSF